MIACGNKLSYKLKEKEIDQFWPWVINWKWYREWLQMNHITMVGIENRVHHFGERGELQHFIP